MLILKPLRHVWCYLALLAMMVGCTTDRRAAEVIHSLRWDEEPAVALAPDTVRLIDSIANQAVEAKNWNRPYTDSTHYRRVIHDQGDHFVVSYLRLEEGEIAHQVGGDLWVVISKKCMRVLGIERGQ